MAVCLLRCLEDLIEYFNKWAFVYVAVYGEAYIPSGKSVINLFKNRGWTALITDQLIGNVISIMVLLIGAVCGGIGSLYCVRAWVYSFAVCLSLSVCVCVCVCVCVLLSCVR